MTADSRYDEVPDRDDPIPDLAVFFASTSAWVLDPRHGEFFDVAGPRQLPAVPVFPTRHGAMLRDLLGVSDAAPRGGRAWLRLNPRDPDSVWQAHDGSGPAAVDAIEQTMERLAGLLRTHPDGGDIDAPAHLAARHRVFLDPDRVRALGLSLAANVHIVLDLRPRRVEAQLRCHLTTWVFTGPPPTGPAFCPAEITAPPAPANSSDLRTIAQQRKLLYDAALEVETRLAQTARFVAVEFRGHWRRYGFPEFWFALPAQPAADPVDYLPPSARGESRGSDPRRPDRAELDDLIVTALDIRDPSDPAVARSVLNADLLVLRRIKREPTSERWGRLDESWSDVPLYLTVPGRRGPTGDAATFAKVEEFVTELADLEVDFSNTLYQLEADLEIWRNHTQLFNIVSDRGSTLWDALSTHLPARRKRALARVHAVIELLHQLLMQALADLAHIEAVVGVRVAEIDDAIDRIGDDFDRQFAERHIGTAPTVRKQLTGTYLYERVHRFGVEAEKETKRVKTTYNDLINTIGAAFDERRVREFDVLNRSNVLFGLFVAVVGLLVALPQIVTGAPFNLSHSGWGRVVVAVPVALVVATIGYVAGIGIRWLGSVGRLGSKTFRRRYNGRPGVWGFLRDASTANLEYLAAEGKLTDAFDRQLAGDFATLWDQARPLEDFSRGASPGADVRSAGRAGRGVGTARAAAHRTGATPAPVPVAGADLAVPGRGQGSHVVLPVGVPAPGPGGRLRRLRPLPDADRVHLDGDRGDQHVAARRPVRQCGRRPDPHRSTHAEGDDDRGGTCRPPPGGGRADDSAATPSYRP